VSKRTGIMLAIPFEESRLAKWPKPWIVQPKLDGMRCVAHWSEHEQNYILKTSQGTRINTVPHINRQLTDLYKVYDKSEFAFDGELYIPHGTFENVVSIVKRNVEHPNSKLVEYHIFDFKGTETKQDIRSMMLSGLKDSPSLRCVPSACANTLADIENLLEVYLQQGYEGFIIRNPSALYEEKRSSNMMKFKPMKTDSYKIVGFEEEISIEGTPKNSLGALILEGSEKSIFNCGSGPVLTKDARAELWTHREALLGKTATIKYQNLTAVKQLPRFPILIEIQ
jgi:ATP-dependent DNA ligase